MTGSQLRPTSEQPQSSRRRAAGVLMSSALHAEARSAWQRAARLALRTIAACPDRTSAASQSKVSRVFPNSALRNGLSASPSAPRREQLLDTVLVAPVCQPASGQARSATGAAFSEMTRLASLPGGPPRGRARLLIRPQERKAGHPPSGPQFPYL